MYHLAIDWRRAKFFHSHPTTAPEADLAVVPTSSSLFIPLTDLDDIIMIRNWLYTMTLRCNLLGRWAKQNNIFLGIVFVFENAADLLWFQRQWGPRMVATA